MLAYNLRHPDDPVHRIEDIKQDPSLLGLMKAIGSMQSSDPTVRKQQDELLELIDECGNFEEFQELYMPTAEEVKLAAYGHVTVAEPSKRALSKQGSISAMGGLPYKANL